MRACSVDLDVLRKNLVGYIETELANLATELHEDPKPTSGFQRVIQRAVIYVQSSGREEMPPMCWSRSSPSARATPPISCRSRT